MTVKHFLSSRDIALFNYSLPRSYQIPDILEYPQDVFENAMSF